MSKFVDRINVETWDGYTTYDGKTYTVTIAIDTVKLIHSLGGKAAKNKTKRCGAYHGLIRATAKELLK